MTAKCLSQKEILIVSCLKWVGSAGKAQAGDTQAAWSSPASLPPAFHALRPSPCTLHPPHCHTHRSAHPSVLSPVPKLPFQAQAPPPADPDSSSESDYEHYDFSAQPPVALTTFYSECLGPGARRPRCLSQGEGPAARGPSVGPT